jgi:hypothetical protein
MVHIRNFNVATYYEHFGLTGPATVQYSAWIDRVLTPTIWIPSTQVQRPDGEDFVCIVYPYLHGSSPRFSDIEAMNMNAQVTALRIGYTIDQTGNQIYHYPKEKIAIFSAILVIL